MIEWNERDRPEDRGYRTLTPATVVDYLKLHGDLARRLGGPPARWRADERGDGNLNLVFVVEGSSGALVVKQALPYVRMVGPGWPLPLTRSHFELAALLEQARWADAFVPSIYASDRDMALIVMEYLGTHEVLRKGLIADRAFAQVGEHVGQFLAHVAYHTSDLHLGAGEKRRCCAGYLGNVAMCKISEDLIFDEPYYSAPMNRHTSPALDAAAAALKSDVALKLAVQEMKWRFLNQPECLAHGDLHTGSVMVTAEDTRVIDPEFAFYGPMGFDGGMFMANLLLAFLSQRGHEREPGGRDAQREHLLRQIAMLWQSFRRTFGVHWQRRAGGASPGDAYHSRLFPDAPGLAAAALERRLAAVWELSLGFAGCEMIRRVVGLSHVEDFEGIATPAVRATCEQHALSLARDLLLRRSEFPSVERVVAAARACA